MHNTFKKVQKFQIYQKTWLLTKHWYVKKYCSMFYTYYILYLLPKYLMLHISYAYVQ